MTLGWTEERFDLLKRYVAGGFTASHIARLIGGVSRNAVISKIHRSGLQLKTPATWVHPIRAPKVKPSNPRNNNPTGFIGKARTKAKPKPPRAFKPVVVDLAAPTCEPVTLLNRTDTQCPWIAGDTHGPATLMCGEAKDITEAFCPFHMAKAKGAEAQWSPRRQSKFAQAMGLVT